VTPVPSYWGEARDQRPALVLPVDPSRDPAHSCDFIAFRQGVSAPSTDILDVCATRRGSAKGQQDGRLSCIGRHARNILCRASPRKASRLVGRLRDGVLAPRGPSWARSIASPVRRTRRSGQRRLWTLRAPCCAPSYGHDSVDEHIDRRVPARPRARASRILRFTCRLLPAGPRSAQAFQTRCRVRPGDERLRERDEIARMSRSP